MANPQAVEDLAQPLKNSSSFKRNKSLPHPATDPGEFAPTNLSNDYGRDFGSPKSSHAMRRVNGMSMPGSFPLNGYDNGLPPTPPRHTHDTSQRVISTPSPRQNGLNHRIQKRPNRTMHANTRSPPTPDTTPPATSSLIMPPRPALTNSSPSSRADSFRTAREEQWSSDDEETPFEKSFLGAVKSAHNQDHEIALGLGFEREDDSSTPTPKTMRHGSGRKVSPKTQSNGTVLQQAEAIPNREWNTELMRNVTIRRKQRSTVPRNKLEEDEQRIVARDIVPNLINGSSEDDEKSEPSTPKHDHFSHSVAPPKTPKQDELSKRLSTSSQASTLLEAIAIPTPPKRQMTLRHVSKNLSLRSRSDGSSSLGLSSRASSNRTSLSDELSMRPLSQNDSVTFHSDESRMRALSTIKDKLIVPPVPLKHHPELRSLKFNADSSENVTGGNRISEGSVISSTTSSPQRAFSGVDHMGFSGRHSTGTAFGKRSELANPKYDIVVKRPMQRAATTGQRDNSPTRAATRKALERLDFSTNTDLEIRPMSYARETLRSTSVANSLLDRRVQSAEQSIRPDSPNEPLALVRTITAGSVTSAKEPFKDSQALEKRPTIESMPRVSLDRSTVTTHELHRASNASSTLRPDSEHAAARHLYAQTTPFSQTSDLHEMGEATAVSIYPHNNNSLLVVQQVARPAGVQKSEFAVSSIPGWPMLTIQPATPPQRRSTPSIANVDSPLKNPRRPPQPPRQSLMAPVINIHPATPQSEIEALDFNATTATRNSHPPMTAPTRSLSLVQRARRYSDTVVRPLITRTSSMRRSYYQRPRSARQGAPKTKQAENTLHPFWQPRGFWDDVSDSDSDFGELDGDARLPPGGDTSDVAEPRGIARVFDGLRTSTGFMIGNSLGLERSGTNRRTPTIFPSVGLGQRTSGRVVRRTSQGTLRSIGTSPPIKVTRSRKSIETLRVAHRMHGQGKKGVWNPRNWQVHYVGVGGMKDMWRERQAEKRRARLKDSIGVSYSVESAPTTD